MILLIAKWLIARNPARTLESAKRIAKVGLIVGALVMLIVGFLLWDHFDDKAAVNADRNESKVEALDTARGADEDAEAATAGKSEEVEDGNDRARKAAADSDDPLRDALSSLRPKADRDCETAGRADDLRC